MDRANTEQDKVMQYRDKTSAEGRSYSFQNCKQQQLESQIILTVEHGA